MELAKDTGAGISGVSLIANSREQRDFDQWMTWGVESLTGNLLESGPKEMTLWNFFSLFLTFITYLLCLTFEGNTS